MKAAKEKRIYLSPPHMSGYEMKYIQEAFDQNWIAPLGPNVDGFEKAIKEYCQVADVAALSSGTAALHLALVMLGIGKGDEVIGSTFTFSATINPIIYQGATPILVDSEEDTWNMDPSLLQQVIEERLKTGEKPKAIIIVHLYGMPAQMDEILEIADHYNIPVIEDAAEALGSKYKGRSLGTFGRMGILSFNGNKILNTSGGGALLSNEQNLIQQARLLSTQARDPAPHYQHSQIGYNYRMSNVIAGLGRGQMEVIEERIASRRANYMFYHDQLKSFPGITFLNEPSDIYYSNRWLTTILIDDKIAGFSREDLQQKLDNQNIESRPLWKPMHLQPVFSSCPAYLNEVSNRLFKIGICLPSGSQMSENELNRVVDTIKSIKKD